MSGCCDCSSSLRSSPPPAPAQAAYFEAPPPVHNGSPPDAKVAFFGALFAARTDVYAVRFGNPRTTKHGWLPGTAAFAAAFTAIGAAVRDGRRAVAGPRRPGSRRLTRA